MSSENTMHGTTILSVRKGDEVVVAGDGQVSLGPTVMKGSAVKVRRLGKRSDVVGGFAGATADAFTLFERLEKKLEAHNGQLMRAAVELAKDWRTDKYLRNLEALSGSLIAKHAHGCQPLVNTTIYSNYSKRLNDKWISLMRSTTDR